MNSRREFIGTPTELAAKIDHDSIEGITPKKVAKQKLQSAEALRKAGITAATRRSNGKRLIEVRRADSDDFSGSEEIDPVDPAVSGDAHCAALCAF